MRETAFCVAPMRKGCLLPDDHFSYIQYGEDVGDGVELFDVKSDPKQYTNLVKDPKFKGVVARYKLMMQAKLKDVRDNDLNLKAKRIKRKKLAQLSSFEMVSDFPEKKLRIPASSCVVWW